MFFVLLLLCATAFFVGKWSYDSLWLIASSIFETGYRLKTRNNKSLYQLPSSGENSNYFFNKFYTVYSIKSQSITRGLRFLFAFGITCYAMTIEIVLWQIKTADASQEHDLITKYIWPLTSLSLTVILILVQPFFILITILNKFFNDSLNINQLVMGTFMSLALMIATLQYMSWGPFYYSKSILTSLSIAGVTVMAILSGIASISTLYYTFSMIFKRRSDISGMQSSSLISRNRRLNLWTTQRQLQSQIDNYERNIIENISILKKMDEDNVGVAAPLRRQMVDKISWFKLEVAKLEKSATQPTLIRNSRRIFEISFLIYCCHKVLITFLKRIPHIISHALKYPNDIDYEYFYDSSGSSSTGSDPLAVTVAKLLDLFLFGFNYKQDLDSLTKQISLLISISLFICTLSTVNTTITYLLSLLPSRIQVIATLVMQGEEDADLLPTNTKVSSRRNPSIIKNLIVSELIGVYVVSTILLIRSNLPFGTALKLKELLGEKFTMPTGAIDSWFDKIYALVCIISVVGIHIAEKSTFYKT